MPTLMPDQLEVNPLQRARLPPVQVLWCQMPYLSYHSATVKGICPVYMPGLGAMHAGSSCSSGGTVQTKQCMSCRASEHGARSADCAPLLAQFWQGGSNTHTHTRTHTHTHAHTHTYTETAQPQAASDQELLQQLDGLEGQQQQQSAEGGASPAVGVEEAARQQQQHWMVNGGFELDPGSGMFYSSKLGLWYNTQTALYMDAQTGAW
eukprot:1156243-Pelagomonas_calceolata.AAC.3